VGLLDLDPATHPGDLMAQTLAPGVRRGQVSAYDRALLGIAPQDAVFAKAVDASGNVLFAGQNHNRIREVLSGSMGPQTTSLAMRSPPGFSGTATTPISIELPPIVTEALQRWAAAGLSSAQVARLARVSPSDQAPMALTFLD
jgi:hypothetical protein